jgi:putative transcriptional regulator
MVSRCTAAVVLLVLCASPAISGDLAAGKFLVASRDLGDPNFAQSVVLLISYEESKGAMGLIVNRRTEVPLSRVFEDLKSAKGRTDEVYLGGPVELSTVMALMKSSVKPSGGELVFGDVYLMASKTALEKAIDDHPEPGSFHVFVGYAGWGPGQLEHEVELGAWNIMSAEAPLVFHPDPDSIWPRLIRRTESQIARLLRAP